MSARDGNEEIYVMSADGSNQTRLTAEPGSDASPKWSPDGRILFTSDRDGRREIYVMDGDGSNVTRLTTIGVRQAAWSADGKKVIFVRNSRERIEGSFPLEIYVADADGSNVKMLTMSLVTKFSPCWSPDGAAIAFNDEKLGVMANIFQVDSDGRNFRRLTTGPKMDERPAYSPDGSKLAFQTNRDGNYEIYIMTLH
jgi:TolB protein